MGAFTTVWLTILMFSAALLYSSVGHAGASGYLSVMAIFNLAPEVMRPTALALNIIVVTITTLKFFQVGAFSWKIFFPLALGSVPFAFIGGSLNLPDYLYKPIVGLVLLYAAFRLFQAHNAIDTMILFHFHFGWECFQES